MMNNYPENDYRNYLMHKAASGSRKSHKYISRKWKNGRWVYLYPKKSSEKMDYLETAKARKEAAIYENRKNADEYDKLFKAGKKKSPEAKEYLDKALKASNAARQYDKLIKVLENNKNRPLYKGAAR